MPTSFVNSTTSSHELTLQLQCDKIYTLIKRLIKGDGPPMPIYEYLCQDCQNAFELIRAIKDADSGLNCSQCNGENIRRKISLFNAASSDRTIGGSRACGSCAGGACGSCAGGSCGTCGSH